jgi:pimeloyl-ACP methyl ester carboxylesterase
MATFERELRERGRFPIPLQLVYAARDPMVPPSVGDRLAALLPDARFVRLERASHFAHVDAPSAFLEAALPFLEGR